MPNDRNKEVIDYTKFFEKEKRGEKPIPQKKYKVSGIFDSFRNFWPQAERKTRIELIILLVVIVVTLAILIFYNA